MFAFAAGGVFSASQVLAEELYKLCGESGGEALVFRDFAGTTHTRADFANSFFQKIHLLLSKTLLTMHPQFS